MSETDVYLLGIGDFSRFTRLSVRMLRHYDERGLLRPAEVDPHSGYRFYAPEQLKVAGRIRALRDAGCGIAQITQMLPLFEDRDAWRTALDQHAASLAAAAQQIAEQQSLLDTIRQHIKENHMSITVEERTLPARRVLSLRRTIPNYQAEGPLWGEFNALLAAAGKSPQFGKTWGTTYFDTEYRETEVDVAIWGELTGPFDPPAGLTVEEVPAQRVAWATMYGDYAQMDTVTDAVAEWVTSHGLTLDGPMFNIFIVSPEQDPNPEHWVTEVNFPVA